MISKQCLGWQWCIWTFLKTLALNTIHTQYTHTHTHTHTVFYHACRGWGWIHSCLYNKEPISASTPSSNHTRRARDWPLARDQSITGTMRAAPEHQIPRDRDHRFSIDRSNWVVEAFSQLSINCNKHLLEMDYAAVEMSYNAI